MKQYKIDILNRMDELSKDEITISLHDVAMELGIKTLKADECREILKKFVKTHPSYKAYKMCDGIEVEDPSLFVTGVVTEIEYEEYIVEIKVYFAETNGNNFVVFQRGAEAKIADAAPSGKLDGIVDLYSGDVVKNLAAYIGNGENANTFDSMYGDVVNFADVERETELHFVCSYEE